MTSDDQLVLLGHQCPEHQLSSWSELLRGLCLVCPTSAISGVVAPRDTLVIAVWCHEPETKALLDGLPSLAGVRQDSTRVLGIYLDTEKSSALGRHPASDIGELSWLRSNSDMVVISSDAGVVVELVETLARSAN